jgi:hypothetical protein
MTGGRLKRVASYLGEETFCLTYGDGLANIDISAELEFHRRHGKLATVAAVQPPGRFGVLNIDANYRVTSFEEKPSNEIGWINGGFFVLEPGVIQYIDGDNISWEKAPLSNIAKDGQLAAFQHTGFWQPCVLCAIKGNSKCSGPEARHLGVSGTKYDARSSLRKARSCQTSCGMEHYASLFGDFFSPDKLFRCSGSFGTFPLG